MTFEENSIRYSIDANQQIKEKEYWLDKLAGEPVKTFFPYDRKPTSEMKSRFNSVTFEYTGEIFEKLMRLSNNSEIRLHIILLAVLAGLLHKYTTRTDIMVGAPVKKQEIEGEFLNTVLILRNQLQGNLTFKDLLLNVSQTLGEASEHVNYPINTLFYHLNIPYSGGEFPLFDVALLVKNIHDKKDIQHLNLNMVFSFYKKDRSLEGEAEYNSSIYHQSTVQQIVSHYRHFLTGALSDINRTLEAIDILGEAGKNRLLFDFNRTESGYPADKVIHQLFAEQVERSPDVVAVGAVGEHSNRPVSITYRELNERSNQLARFLTREGLAPVGIAAFLVDRSLEMIFGILAVLKAGGGYLPIDPDYPIDRITYMLEDSNATVLLTAGISPDNISFNKKLVDLGDERNYQRERGNLKNVTSPADLCYIIYTSGTTGNPKGVMIEHRNVVRLMFNENFLFDFDKTDVWTMFHSYCFDFSVWEMYGALLYGGKLLLVTKTITRDPGRYQKIVVEEQVSVLNQTPSGFKNLMNAELQSLQRQYHLKYVIFGGEALHTVILKEWKARYPKTRFINMYGITETTVHVTYKEITDAEIEMNGSGIGTPIPTLTAYIMDQEQRLLPIGVPGEICVGGEGVARGYLNRPELTGEKFIKNSYIPGERLYRSGDVGMMTDGGEIEYLGRIDNQVKIRGHRIELGEIEEQLLKFTPVKDAVVVAREDKNSEKQLAAYLVPHPRHCFTIHRLLELEKQSILRNQQYYCLPNGITVFYLNRGETDFMYEEIFEKCSYIRHGITLEQGACIFDVGANIGIFSLFVNQHCKSAKIFAFEPLPPIFEVLSLNTSIYEADIKIFPCGLSGNEGEMDFTYYPNATVLSGGYADETQEMKNVRAFMRNQPSLESQPGEPGIWEHQLEELLTARLTTSHFTCQLKTISIIIKENEVDSIDLLKIDVEKSETDVLKGINEEDWSRIRQIVIEVHNVDGRLKMLTEMLKNRGYEVVCEQDSQLHDTDLYNIYARKQNPGHEKNHLRQTDLNQCPGQRWTSSEHLIDDIRDFLKEKLPDYMIPAYFMILEQLPLTPNGKIHRNALPEIEARVSSQYMAPKSNMEKKVADIWKEILKLERVGLNDSFFDVGGTSINVIQVNTRLREEFAVNIPVVKMFEYPTVGTFANYLDQRQTKTDESQGKSVNEMEDFDLIHDHSLDALEQTLQLLETE